MADGTLKVGTITTSSGSGTITIGQSGETINTPSGATITGVATNVPAFEAVGVATNISDATTTKLQFTTERIDTDSCYDNSSTSRFTPTVAGKYYIYSTCQLRCDTSNTVDGCFLHIYKNGSYVTKAAQENQSSRQFGNCLTTSTIVDMNGSSDYVEVYGYIDVSSGQPSQPADNRCIFGGYKLIG